MVNRPLCEPLLRSCVRARRVVRRLHSEERGTVAVMSAIVFLAMAGMLALVLDLGYGFGQRRLAQNVADSAAVAATKVVAQNVQLTGSQTDSGVLGAVRDAARTASGEFLDQYSVDYVDAALAPLGIAVGAAPGGTIPTGARGVRVTPSKSIPTFFARVLGVSSLIVGTRATAKTDTVVGLHPGMYAPYVLWAGEPEFICRDSSNTPIPNQNPVGSNGNEIPTANPYGAYRYGCNIYNLEFNFRCNNYNNCNVSNNNPRWAYNSNDFKGYLHQSNAYLEADRADDFTVGTGNSIGTADEPLEDLSTCYANRNLGCTIAMPVIDWADNGASGQIRLRVIDFVNVRLSADPASLAPSQPWRGVAVPGSLTYSAGRAVTSGVAPTPGQATVQYVRLVQ